MDQEDHRDQGESRWTRRTMRTMVLGVEPGALWSCFYILLMYLNNTYIGDHYNKDQKGGTKIGKVLYLFNRQYDIKPTNCKTSG